MTAPVTGAELVARTVLTALVENSLYTLQTYSPYRETRTSDPGVQLQVTYHDQLVKVIVVPQN